VSTPLSQDEIAQTVRLLQRLTPGFLPFDIFHQVARLVALPIVEVVPLRRTAAGQVEVLLLERPADDPVWPSMLHTPGTVVRATDTPGSFDDPLQRILQSELAGTPTGKPVFVQSLLHHQARGAEVSQIFWVEVMGEPTVGQFYPADALPATVVQTQVPFILDAVDKFRLGAL